MPAIRPRVLALVAATLVVGGAVMAHSGLPESLWTGGGPKDRDIGVAITRGPFEVVVAAAGIIQPIEIVDVGAQVSGQLAALHVKLGDRVEAGQLLAEIDDRLIKAKLVQGEAAAENLRAQINAKNAQLAYARLHQSRTDTLSERSIAPKAQAELAKSNVAVLEAEVRALEAQLTGQLAALDGIRLDLEYTRISAPVGGVVTALVAQRGQTLNANQQAPVILRISRDRPLMLVARVPEADIERIRPGLPVRFTLVGGPSRTYEGAIGAVLRAPTIINDVVFYDAIVMLGGEKDALAFGRTAQVFITLERLDCAVLLPRRILPDDAVAGDILRVSVRQPKGTRGTRFVTLQALNEVNGAVECKEADRVGFDASERVVTITRDRRDGGE